MGWISDSRFCNYIFSKMAVVDHNQSLFDFALQYCGDVSQVFEIAILNNLSITEDLVPGTLIKLPVATNPGLVKFFLDKNIVPASGMSKADNEHHLTGIDYWAIGIDFIVS